MINDPIRILPQKLVTRFDWNNAHLAKSIQMFEILLIFLELYYYLECFNTWTEGLSEIFNS